MVIQVDVDGVIANFQKGYLALANSMFGLDIPLDWLRPTWDAIPTEMTKDMDRKVWKAIVVDPTFWEKLEPLVSPTVIRDLHSLGEVYYVTSRNGVDVLEQTKTWLWRQCFIPGPNVIVSKRKADAALALGATYMIDDKAGNCLATYYNSPKTKVYVLDAPYNQFDHAVVGNAVKRVASFDAFVHDIREEL